ncbi:MAG: hypothetical protein KME04_08435 [Pleurocapsa minor GSE-CHR-MK-17-07R]|jgi:hypothetical protein|nr:hypothetical protein [Pleurocapsa minor GSE-CHR-MK 17-07R]
MHDAVACMGIVPAVAIMVAMRCILTVGRHVVAVVCVMIVAVHLMGHRGMVMRIMSVRDG